MKAVNLINSLLVAISWGGLSACDPPPIPAGTVEKKQKPIKQASEVAIPVVVKESPVAIALKSSNGRLREILLLTPGERRVNELIKALASESDSKAIMDFIDDLDKQLDASEFDGPLRSMVGTKILRLLSVEQAKTLGELVSKDKSLRGYVYGIIAEKLWEMSTPVQDALAYGLTLAPDEARLVFARFTSLDKHVDPARTASIIDATTGLLLSSTAPARDELATVFGGTVYNLGDHSRASVLGQTLQASPEIFAGFSKSYMDNWLNYDSIEATSWLLKQDSNWQAFGAVGVVDYLVRKADMESAQVWLKKVPPGTKLGQLTDWFISTGKLKRNG